MKNGINNISLKFMLIAFFAIAFNFSTGAVSSAFESSNQNSENTSGQLFDNTSSNNDDMWGSSKSTAFDNSTTPANAGTKMNAPGDPGEPGATCVPVPVGTMVLLGMAFLYGLVVLYKSKKVKN